MGSRAQSQFEVKSWHEETITEIGTGGKLTRASYVQTHTGDVAGEETVECLMWYRPDGTVHTVALSHFTGSVGDRAGELVLQSTGSFADGVARSTAEVVSGSGSGALTGLRGERTAEVGHSMAGSATFDYDLDPGSG